MKNLKKLITAVLAAAMVLSVAGCGSSNTPSAPDANSAAASGGESQGAALTKITASGQPYSHTLPPGWRSRTASTSRPAWALK